MAENSYRVAVVVHTRSSDWSKLQIAGIRSALHAVGSDISRVIECGFASATQVAALQVLLDERPDAVISIPVDSLGSAEVHRRLAESQIKLVLMDNAPVGMVAQKDYVSVVSADNFGNGEVAAAVLQDHVPEGGRVVVVGYGVDFPVTNERELGFRKALSEQRPDIRIDRIKFGAPEDAGDVVEARVTAAGRPDALFVVWDEPATLASAALRAAGLEIPIATVDLGLDVAIEIAGGGPIIGGGAQLPFDQGYAEATAAIMALAGDRPPPWVALPALAVTRDNVLESYRAVWHDEPPPELISAFGG